MRLKSFDGENMLIHGCGDGETVHVNIAKDGTPVSFEDWFIR
jgi:hypothetical protein